MSVPRKKKTAPTVPVDDNVTILADAALNKDDIVIVGARVHNLKDVSLRIPKNKITVFTGVSGSGKSSIVFDTIGVEAQRQLNSTFSWFIRNQLPKYERPHADLIENLTTPVIVDQKPMGGNARSTVGTITDISPLIRSLFARFASPTTGRVSTFSFNDPQGMCPDCDGLGRAVRMDINKMFDTSKSLDEGAIQFADYRVDGHEWQIWARSGQLDPTKPLRRFTKAEWQMLLTGTGPRMMVTTKNTRFAVDYEGVESRFTRNFLKRDLSTLSDRRRDQIERFITDGECASCDGARLSPEALAAKINGRNIAEWSRMQISDLLEVLTEIKDPVAASLATVAQAALSRVAAIGLGYLSLDRPTGTLSGGEGQRLKLVRHLGSSLKGMTYIFDEPSIGLHPHDVGRLNTLLKALRDKGNTVLVVEHDPDVIEIADHVVDVGPGAGVHGGQILFEGTFAELRAADTHTGAGLRRSTTIKETVREPTGKMSIVDADLHNLKQVSVDIPTGVLTAVTGVAGSGKSTLIAEVFLGEYPESIFVDQSAIGASSRSTPTTYLDMMDPIRTLFAKATKASAALFSFNSKGACEECQGRGVIITELAFMDPVTTSCEACQGRRFNETVLAHKLRGKSIADVLEMSAEEALEFFTEPAVHDKLRFLNEVGLDYLSLGQSLSTLSGGELQRIKLAVQLHRTGSVYVLDEPTTGLHMSDVDKLLDMMNRLVDNGNTVVVIEHNLDVIQQADWIIDLGPEGGKNGGEIVFTGTPKELVKARGSLTGEHLRRYRSPRREAGK